MVVVRVRDLSGVIVFREDVPMPTAEDLLQKLNCCRLDQLLQDDHIVEGEIQPMHGDGDIFLTLVRIRYNLLDGLSAEMVARLSGAGALAAPLGCSHPDGCMSLITSDEEVDTTCGSYRVAKTSSHVLLFPNGVILVKYSYESHDEEDYCGCDCKHLEIAEGKMEPDTSMPGKLLVTWAGCAALRWKRTFCSYPPHFRVEQPDPAAWQKRDSAQAVRLESGRLNLSDLCSTWAQSHVSKPHLSKGVMASMPGLSEAALLDLEMDPGNLWFWCPPGSEDARLSSHEPVLFLEALGLAVALESKAYSKMS